MGPLTKDLEASIVGLPHDYRVMVGWDPQVNQDVGWITLKQGVEFNFDSLQVRDFNLNIRGFVFDGGDGASQEYPSSSTSTTDTIMYGKQDVLKNSEKPKEMCPEEQVSELKLYGPKTCFLPLGANANKDLVTCNYCNRKVTNLPVHEKKCQVKNAKNQERVECPLCDFKPTSAGISSHLKNHFKPKRTCPFCKNVISEEKYDSHLQKCSRCSFCGMLFTNKFLLLRHRELKHPGSRLKKPCINRTDEGEGQDEINGAFTGNDEKYKNVATLEDKRDDLVGNDNENRYTNITSVNGNSNGHVDEDESREITSILQCTSEGEGPAGYKKGGINSEEDQCRLHFEFQGEETIEKNIKISMFEPVGKAMKKFCAYKKCVRLFGSRLEDLEFKSNGTLLTGEEYAGSIEDGMIKVNKKNDDDQDRRGGYFVAGDLRNPLNLDHYPQDQKKYLSVLRPPKALSLSAYENDHDEMKIDSTEVVVKFAQY